MSSGIGTTPRQQLIKDRGTIDPDGCRADRHGKADRRKRSVIPELNNTKDTLVKLNATTNSILNTLEESGADITEYQTLLKNIKTSLGNLENLMDDLDDKTGSEWLYIDSLKKNISDMQKDLKALRNDLDDLSDPVGSISSDVVSAISNVQDILKDLNDYGLISDDRYSSINGTLDTMKNNSSNLGDSFAGCEQRFVQPERLP